MVIYVTKASYQLIYDFIHFCDKNCDYSPPPAILSLLATLASQGHFVASLTSKFIAFCFGRTFEQNAHRFVSKIAGKNNNVVSDS